MNKFFNFLRYGTFYDGNEEVEKQKLKKLEDEVSKKDVEFEKDDMKALIIAAFQVFTPVIFGFIILIGFVIWIFFR